MSLINAAAKRPITTDVSMEKLRHGRSHARMRKEEGNRRSQMNMSKEAKTELWRNHPLVMGTVLLEGVALIIASKYANNLLQWKTISMTLP